MLEALEVLELLEGLALEVLELQLMTVRPGYRSVALIWCENANPGKCICESAISCPSYAAQGYALALEGGNNGRGCSSAMGICARAWRALRAVDRAWRGGVVSEKSA